MWSDSTSIILVAMSAGFLSGLLSSTLDLALRIKLNQQEIPYQKIVITFLLSSSLGAIIFSVGIFILTILEPSMSASELNEFSIFLAAFLAPLPIIMKVFEYAISLLKKFFSPQN